MSFLAPLFFAAAAAISLPVLMHLIRRRPKNEMLFSSLMFLRPSPPRLTRRSRLDNLLLLLLRGLALLLLAVAFARPFVRTYATSEIQPPGRTILLLVDTSASMRRGDLWQRAQAEALSVLEDLDPRDRIALVTYDDRFHPHLDLEAADALPANERAQVVRDLLGEQQPSWNGSALGSALVQAADLISPSRSLQDSAAPDARATILLVSDMQAGSDLDALSRFEWPEDVHLDIHAVASNAPTNASMSLLDDEVTISKRSDSEQRLRVRVSNTADARQSQFLLYWQSQKDGTPAKDRPDAPDRRGEDYPIVVPASQTRVVRVTPPSGPRGTLRLLGDDHDYDNRLFIAYPDPQQQKLLLVSDAAEDPRDSIAHYVEQLSLDSRARTVELIQQRPADFAAPPDPGGTPLAIVSAPLEEPQVENLRDYVQRGGRVLYVLTGQHQPQQYAANIKSLTETPIEIGEAEVADYAMLGRVNFSHPLFASFAEPPYNDFTTIRFWSHRVLGGIDDESWETVAAFDSGMPALVERRVGDGFLWLLASGWQPAESQLALSTKFVPLVVEFFDRGTDPRRVGNQIFVGDTLPVDSRESVEIETPGNGILASEPGQQVRATAPGFYSWPEQGRVRTVAVNVPVAESRTEPLDVDQVAQFGIPVDPLQSRAEAIEQSRVLKDQELESRQKLWQWILALVLAILAAESLLSGLQAKRKVATVG